MAQSARENVTPRSGVTREKRRQRSDGNVVPTFFVIPAQAGIHIPEARSKNGGWARPAQEQYRGFLPAEPQGKHFLDSRLRGNERDWLAVHEVQFCLPASCELCFGGNLYESSVMSVLRALAFIPSLSRCAGMVVTLNKPVGWALPIKKDRDYHQFSENRKGRRGRLIGYVAYGAERRRKRYTAERCNEGKPHGFKLRVIPAKAGIQDSGRGRCPSSSFRGNGLLSTLLVCV